MHEDPEEGTIRSVRLRLRESENTISSVQIKAAENSKGRGTTDIVHTENRIAARSDNGKSHSRKISQQEQSAR